MFRHALIYGLALGLLALLLAWIDFSHAMRLWSTEFYVIVVAALFAGLGAWLGRLLTPARLSSEFARNDPAIAALGISTREREVLDLLAEGCSNKVIARRLKISPNTVKTHVSRVFEKLDVASRTQAIQKARKLEILP